MTRLLMVRHGETAFNVNRRFMGHSDIELSDLGKRQIERLRGYLAGEILSAAYASDLQRCMVAAEKLVEGRSLQVRSAPELRETNYGLCEGLTFTEIGRQYPDVAQKCVSFTPDLEFPQGEAFHAFADRVISFMDRVKDAGPRESILAVSHNGPIKVLICHLLGISFDHWGKFRVEPASLSIIDISSWGAVLSRLNDTAHLNGLT